MKNVKLRSRISIAKIIAYVLEILIYGLLSALYISVIFVNFTGKYEEYSITKKAYNKDELIYLLENNRLKYTVQGSSIQTDNLHYVERDDKTISFSTKDKKITDFFEVNELGAINKEVILNSNHFMVRSGSYFSFIHNEYGALIIGKNNVYYIGFRFALLMMILWLIITIVSILVILKKNPITYIKNHKYGFKLFCMWLGLFAIIIGGGVIVKYESTMFIKDATTGY